jgi:hypothetical protein
MNPDIIDEFTAGFAPGNQPFGGKDIKKFCL